MSNLINKVLNDLDKAAGHLRYSYAKVSRFDFKKSWSEEELETLESFSSRFARYSDLIVSRYFRLLIKDKDPAFRGSTIDLLNMAEKYGWISSALTWRRIRELRNIAAHEYAADDYRSLYTEVFNLASELIKFDPKSCA